MWGAIVQGALSVAGTIGKYQIEKGQYKAQRTLDKANYYVQEVMRAAENEASRINASVGNHLRSVSNQRLIKAAGEAYNAMGENLGRALDQSVTGSLQRRVVAAEEVGAFSAANAAAGVGGSTVDMINGSIRLRNAMLESEVAKQEGLATYDQMQQRIGVVSNAYDQWDYTYDMAQQNYFGAQMPIRAKNSSIFQTFVGNSPQLFQAGQNIVNSWQGSSGQETRSVQLYGIGDQTTGLGTGKRTGLGLRL